MCFQESQELIEETLSLHGYEYTQFLGKGGFSSVYLCQSPKYHQYFAVKRSKIHRLTEDEYNFLVTLNHPNIIRLYDSFHDEFAQYLVMEYCPNGTMKENGNLPYDKFVYYSKQVLEAIAFCHSNNVAHRDIKPDNIFLDRYNHVKLADFGMAKCFNINTKSSEKCGSLLYLSPEMLQNREICPFKADIWALGITFFYMATGQYPFPHSNTEELKQMIYIGAIDFDQYELHPKVRYLLGKMLIKDHNNRPNARKLLELPIFQSVNSPAPNKGGNNKCISVFRTHSSFSLLKPKSLDASRHKFIKPGNINEIMTYKSGNKIPKLTPPAVPVNTF